MPFVSVPKVYNPLLDENFYGGWEGNFPEPVVSFS
jgi:hypothetical protein